MLYCVSFVFILFTYLTEKLEHIAEEIVMLTYFVISVI